MAKGGKKTSSGEVAPIVVPKALEPAIELFDKGDYVHARALLAAKADDTSLSDGARDHARQLIRATHLERETVLTGLGCVALLLVVIIVTVLTQP